MIGAEALFLSRLNVLIAFEAIAGVEHSASKALTWGHEKYMVK